MGIVKDAELRKGKAELVKVLNEQGVEARTNERLEALARKVSGGGSGGSPERFGDVVLVVPTPVMTVSTAVAAI